MDLLIEEVELPKSTKGTAKKGSKYFNDNIKAIALKLGSQPQSFLVPSIEGSTPKNLQLNVSYYLNKWGKTLAGEDGVPTPKAFTTRLEEGGLRVWLKA